VDLSAYANQSINIRFVFGSDDNTTSVGWYIDEVTLFDAVFVTNEACFTSSVGDADCSEVTTMIFEPLVNNCQNSLTYTNEVIPNATDEHLNQFIETVGTVTINSGSAVELAAGDYVLMNAGFEIFQGAEVHIYIGPCN